VDTLRVAESLRRLRKLQFLESAHVEGRECATSLGQVVLSCVSAFTGRSSPRRSNR
jgi:hypothetical protein